MPFVRSLKILDPSLHGAPKRGAAALLLLLCSTALFAAEVQFVSGTNSCKGELISLTEKELTWRDEKNKTIVEPLPAVLGIELQPAVPLPKGLKYVEVKLTGGSLLHCSRFALKTNEVELTLAVSGLTARVPLGAVAYILNDADDPAIQLEWRTKHLGKKRNQDYLAFRPKGGGSAINGLEVTLGGNNKGQVVFELERHGKRAKYEMDPARIQGMIFLNSLSPQAPPPVCQVYDVNQNVLTASRVTADAKSFAITLVCGAQLNYPLSAIARLDYRSDRLVYLSDLKPMEVVEKTKQGRTDNWRGDKNLEGSSIQIEGQVYSKGISLHSHTELVYALDGKYKELKAILGMDDTVGGDGSPVVKIEGDGKELFGCTVSRKEKRREIALDVKGIKQLRIIVTSSGLFDFGDHVDFADARLCK